jgi:hypothetical protein
LPSLMEFAMLESDGITVILCVHLAFTPSSMHVLT